MANQIVAPRMTKFEPPKLRLFTVENQTKESKAAMEVLAEFRAMCVDNKESWEERIFCLGGCHLADRPCFQRKPANCCLPFWDTVVEAEKLSQGHKEVASGTHKSCLLDTNKRSCISGTATWMQKKMVSERHVGHKQFLYRKQLRHQIAVSERKLDWANKLPPRKNWDTRKLSLRRLGHKLFRRHNLLDGISPAPRFSAQLVS